MRPDITTANLEQSTCRRPPLFPLGRLFITPGALAALSEAKQSPEEFLRRHQRGDWGELCEEDRRENALSLAHGYRLMSVYHISTGIKLWLITEHDRTATTILLPSEY